MRWCIRIIGKLAAVGIILSLIPLIYLDVIIQAKFEGRRWSVPAKVYARPLELFTGMPLLQSDLMEELNELGYRKVTNVEKPGSYHQFGDTVLLHTRGFQFWSGYESPVLAKLIFQEGRLAYLEEAKTNQPLTLIRIEPLVIGGIFPAHNEDRELVKITEVPPLLTDILIATEDRSFYQHHGISLRGFTRAMWINVKNLTLKQGGSTLTQQLVKNFYLTSARTVSRKLIEMPMALLLDLHYDKADILETYLNEVYLGQAGSRAIHGFGLASEFYFGQPLSELDVHQLALLVGLVKGPSVYDPRRYPERAIARRNTVLDILADQAVISQEQAEEFKAKPLDVIEIRMMSKSRYPAYLDLVKQQLIADYREEDLTSEGLRIFTNLDPIVQKQAEKSVTATLKKLEERYHVDQDALQAAVVVTNVETGDVVALVGDRHPQFQGFNRALDAYRPIGSLIKPIVYLKALETKQFNLISLLDDTPFSIKSQTGQTWRPQNYDHQNHGLVPLYLALAKSYNVATVHLGVELGVESVLETLRDVGIEKPINPYPSVLLGATDMSPLEVTKMYQTIASDGFNVPLRAIREVLTANRQPLKRYPYTVKQAVDPAAVYVLHYAMQETMKIGTGQSVYSSIAPNFAIAGKTGTTNDSRDSWFAGFTNDKLAVVWVGRDDNQKTPLTGSSGALRIWTKLMDELHDKKSLEHTPPKSVVHLWVNKTYQAITDPHCESAQYMPFIVGTEPSRIVDCQGNVRETKRTNPTWFKNWFFGE